MLDYRLFYIYVDIIFILQIRLFMKRYLLVQLLLLSCISLSSDNAKQLRYESLDNIHAIKISFYYSDSDDCTVPKQGIMRLTDQPVEIASSCLGIGSCYLDWNVEVCKSGEDVWHSQFSQDVANWKIYVFEFRTDDMQRPIRISKTIPLRWSRYRIKDYLTCQDIAQNGHLCTFNDTCNLEKVSNESLEILKARIAIASANQIEQKKNGRQNKVLIVPKKNKSKG